MLKLLHAPFANIKLCLMYSQSASNSKDSAFRQLDVLQRNLCHIRPDLFKFINRLKNFLLKQFNSENCYVIKYSMNLFVKCNDCAIFSLVVVHFQPN